MTGKGKQEREPKPPTEPSTNAHVELDETELDQVSGGVIHEEDPLAVHYSKMEIWFKSVVRKPGS